MAEVTDPKPDPVLEQMRETLLQLVPPLVAAIEAPQHRREQLRDTLRGHLTLRRVALHNLRQSAVPGQGTLAAALFDAELARVTFAEGQLVHLNEQALLYTLGVFAVDGRPGDYVMPWADRPTSKPAAERD